MKKVKVIFHIDLNQFFCAVAIIENPKLLGKAFAIGRENTYKGVLSTASYEARKYGIKAGMSQLDALRLNRNLIIVSPKYSSFEYYSKLFFNILKKYTSILVQTSIDEGYIDVTKETIESNIHPIAYAKKIQDEVLNELNLSCSIGIAPTLFLAKMASDLKKPLGISVLRKRDAINQLKDKSVGTIYGIGKKTLEKLTYLNILTIGDFLKEENKKMISQALGEKHYLYFVEALNGNTSDNVAPHESKTISISHSRTYDIPLKTLSEVISRLLHFAELLTKELKEKEYACRTITITFRDTTFKTITRSVTIEYTDDLEIIKSNVLTLIDLNYNDGLLRLVGLTLGNLKPKKDTVVVTLFNVGDVYTS